MKTVVLAAGKSNRVKPIGDKNFLKFCGKYLLEWQLDNMVKAGLDDFVIVAGPHNYARVADFADGYAKRTEVVEQVGDGMSAGILAAKKAIGDEPFLVVSSNDVVDDEAYSVMMEAVKDESFDGFLLAKKVEEYFPGGYLQLGHESRIEHIVEKPGAGNEPSDLVNVVVHYHRNPKVFFEYLEKAASGKDDVYEVAMANMMKEDVAFRAVEYSNFWKAIKYPWHIFEVADYFFDRTEGGVSDEAEIADGAIIKGNVVIEAGAKVFEGAIVVGPAYIGEGSVIANNALVRGSYVGKNCVVGYSTEVARSFLGDDVWTHSNYIGDSVIGNNCSFGGGTVVGNLRLDEKTIGVRTGEIGGDGERVDSGTNKFGIVMGDNVRVGINTSFMPGVRIGEGAFVGAGIVIGKDVPDRKFVRGKWELEMSDNDVDLDENARDEMREKMGD